MKPINNRKTWTKEEDEIFKKLVKEKTRLKDIATILQTFYLERLDIITI